MLNATRAMAITAAGLVAATALAACGGTTDASSGASSDIGFAKTAVARADKGTATAPPTTGPKAVAGKSIWYISCGQLAIGCSVPAAAAKSAAEAIGWKFTLYDGSFNAGNKYSTGIEQALADKADGIILGGIDCSAVKPALQKAKAQGVKVLAFQAFDCDDPSVGGQALFSAPATLSTSAPTWPDFIKQWGAIKADWIIDHTKGKARVIELQHKGHLLGDYLHKGFTTEFAKCSSCKIVATVPILDADLTSEGLGKKVSAAILAHPDANTIQAPYDSFLPLGVAAAVARSGKAKKISVIGGEGYPANLDGIRSKKGQTAAAAWSVQWAEWSLVDSMNRLFAGDKPVAAGLGFTLVDSSHNLPAATGAAYKTVDFESAYKKIWTGQ